MSYETDERLKSYLDTNQLGREQLCRDVLSVDPRFDEVTPRHPRGGPDGGRDLEARYRQRHLTFGAVGFINQATDSSENKRAARAKFQSDLRRALSAEPKPECFVFFTNINLSVTEKDELVKSALAEGLTYCEVMDRERLRIALDGPDGFSARFQHLGLPLSEAEQASFFAKWGDDIQGVVSSGFARVDSTLRRLLFLQEASSVLSEFVIFFELDRTYAAEEIGHFRAFCYMHLKEPKHGIFGVLFGSSDRANRMREDWPGKPKEDEPGIAKGIGSGQWEQHLEPGETFDYFGDDEELEWVKTASGSSIGMDPVTSVDVRYLHDSFIRFSPRLTLRDIDQASFVTVLNASLADKLKTMHVYANYYKLLTVEADQLRSDVVPDLEVPTDFTCEELQDAWVRLRPQQASAFELSFMDTTPLRVITPQQIGDNPAAEEGGGTHVVP